MTNSMINFTVGPVMSSNEIIAVAAEQTPYFRTAEFSTVMLENEKLMLKYLNAPVDSKCVFLTTSGTGAMESCVMNVLNENDKVLVINGGSFGQRFVGLCELHKLEFSEIKCEFGQQVKEEQLNVYDNCGYTALLVNMHETSSGVLYDMKLISDFCKRNNVLLIIDAISAFIADEIDMSELGAGVVLTGSQKALAVQPGISVIALNPEALKRVECNTEKCMYLSLKEALKNMERGQTPYTPAVTILLQINKRLKMIEEKGGIKTEAQIIRQRAEYFRDKITEYGFTFVVENECNRSNAVTTVRTANSNAGYIFNTLKDEYGIWICPNGGEYKDEIFRVGHIGELSLGDYDRLFDALGKLNL